MENQEIVTVFPDEAISSLLRERLMSDTTVFPQKITLIPLLKKLTDAITNEYTNPEGNGASIKTFFDKISLSKAYKYERPEILSGIIDKIIILYYREVMDGQNIDGFCYLLLLHVKSRASNRMKSEVTFGWKCVNIYYSVRYNTYDHIYLCDVNILKSNKDNLEFISTYDHFFTLDLSSEYKYNKIDRNKAILFKLTSDKYLYINVIINALSVFFFAVKNIPHDSIGIADKSKIRKIYVPNDKSVEMRNIPMKLIYNSLHGQDITLILTKYILNNYIEYKYGRYLEYNDYLKCMYYAFLPIVQLNKIGICFLHDEIVVMENIIEILREGNKSEQESLPILLLRAVVLEHTLMLYRKIVQS